MVVIVPNIPIIPQTPSPEAEALGAKIIELVRILREENPKISAQDVRQALHLAKHRMRREIGGSQWVLLMAAAAVVILAVVGVLVASSEPSVKVLVMTTLVGVIALGLAAIAIFRR